MKEHIGIVGSGIVGLAHAVALLKGGYRVTLFEKSPKPYGASIRNFGLIWPIGQPQGPTFERALRTREIWKEMAEEAGFWIQHNGSLHLAHHDDEMAVLQEYVDVVGGAGVNLMTPDQIQEISPLSNSKEIKGGLFSETESTVNPPEAIWALHEWVANHPQATVSTYDAVLAIEQGTVYTSTQQVEVDHVFVCSGQDLQTLYPDLMMESGMILSKLQMLRTKPLSAHQAKGPTLCGGLTLTHYSSFTKQCSQTEVVRRRFEQTMPQFVEWGIHVMASFNNHCQITIGDSHEYGLGFDPFEKAEVNEWIMHYLSTMMDTSMIEMDESWHGIYPKHPSKTEFIAQPEEGVTIVNGLGGAGMTLSFGLAEEVIEKELGVHL
jgi:FAD dependent oxidoreductase TIGR03364